MIKDLPQKLKALRKEKDLSLKEVAERLGDKSVSIISDYESGHRTPSLTNLMKLASLYNVTIDYLLGLEREKKLVIDTSKMSARQISAILTMVDALNEGK